MPLLKDKRYFHVSNRQALLAMLILALAALAGLPRDGALQEPGSQPAPAVSQSAERAPVDEARPTQSKLNVLFMLFRHG